MKDRKDLRERLERWKRRLARLELDVLDLGGDELWDARQEMADLAQRIEEAEGEL